MNTIQQGRQNNLHLCQQHARNENSYTLQFNNCSFSQETCIYLYSTASTMSSSPKESRTPFLQSLPWKRWMNTGIKRCLPLTLTEGPLSQFRWGRTRVAMSLTHSSCVQSCSFLQLFVNYEEECDLMWRRERMGPGQKTPHPGGSATNKRLFWWCGPRGWGKGNNLQFDWAKGNALPYKCQSLCSTAQQRKGFSLEKRKNRQ